MHCPPNALKLGYRSSHQFALDRVSPGSRVLDVGCGPGFIAQQLSARNVRTISIDRFITAATREHFNRTVEANLDAMYANQPACPVSRRASRRLISLPLHLQLDWEDVQRVCAALASNVAAGPHV
jgi:hypothetical protein